MSIKLASGLVAYWTHAVVLNGAIVSRHKCPWAAEKAARRAGAEVWPYERWLRATGVRLAGDPEPPRLVLVRRIAEEGA